LRRIQKRFTREQSRDSLNPDTLRTFDEFRELRAKSRQPHTAVANAFSAGGDCVA
jgi:hypothetical protein